MTGPDPLSTPAAAAQAATSARDSLMRTYAEPPVTFVRGQGTVLVDTDGKEYLDFITGLAVVSLGHAHPAVAAAIAEQAQTLSHVSNLYGNTLGPEVARTIDRLINGGTGQAGGQVFFANSGAEANECALKLARRWAGDGRHVVLSADNSFHGRTLATLTATGQPEKHTPFRPLPEGFVHVPYDDVAALDKALDTDTVAAVLLEPLQGEGGVVVPSSDYLGAVRALCTERNALLMLDEVQTGLGHGDDVGPQTLGLEGEPVPGAAEAGLHLVEHEQGIAFRAQGTDGTEVVRARHHDPAFALQGLEQHGGHRVGVERLVQRGDVVVGHVHEPFG